MTFPLKGEDLLNHLFAEFVRHSADFRCWLLAQTKFRDFAVSSLLLSEAEYLVRPRRYWWQHWWCANIPGCGEKETDIFLVFQTDDSFRFALHIENKLRGSKFQLQQAECYKKRAIFMMSQPQYLNYSDFETILLSPRSFREKYKTECQLFDKSILHEDVAEFIPEFGGSN